MSRFDKRLANAVSHFVLKYARDVYLQDSHGERHRMHAVRRPPRDVEIGASGESRDIIRLHEWLLEKERLDALIKRLPGNNPLYNGEKILDGNNTYVLDRLTPFEEYDGCAAMVRLNTAKVNDDER